LTPLPLGDHDIQNENKRRDERRHAGLAQSRDPLAVLIVGASFVIWGTVHDQPEPLPA
jgi:hypothetical protein